MKSSFQIKRKNIMRKKSTNCQAIVKFFVLLFAVNLIMLSLNAQQPVQLTLKDALNYALQANQNARKAKLDVENSQYQIDEVRARALPQINGSAGLTYNPLLQKSALPNIF